MGTHYEYIPDTGNIPLVADISSCVLSEPLDVSKFGLLFAGAQKNLAPAGVTLVIIREDLITETPLAGTPTMLSYKLTLITEVCTILRRATQSTCLTKFFTG